MQVQLLFLYSSSTSLLSPILYLSKLQQCVLWFTLYSHTVFSLISTRQRHHDCCGYDRVAAASLIVLAVSLRGSRDRWGYSMLPQNRRDAAHTAAAVQQYKFVRYSSVRCKAISCF